MAAILGMAAILVMWLISDTIWTNINFPHPKECPYEIWVELAQWFQMFEKVDGQTPESLCTHPWAHTSSPHQEGAFHENAQTFWRKLVSGQCCQYQDPVFEFSQI